MNVLRELRQFSQRLEQIVAESDRMRRSEAQTFQTVDRVDGFEQLHEWTLAFDGWKFVPAIKVHDLAEQSDFFHPAGDEFPDFPHDFIDRTAAFLSPGARDDAKRAMHVASLHDRNERRRLALFQFVIPNRFRGANLLL